jgi:hypothetical protein
MLSLLGVWMFGFAQSAMAYQDVLDNAEVLERGHFKATGALQALTDSGGGNFTGVFDTGIQPDWGVRALAGFGKTDYYFGGMVKWVPIPDREDQPAVGLNAGVTYAKWMEDVHDTTFIAQPMISKRLNIQEVVVTPYASLPFGIRLRDTTIHDNTTKLTSELVIGSQLQVPQWKNLQFIAEVGIDFSNAFDHISAGAIFYFDTENGFRLE